MRTFKLVSLVLFVFVLLVPGIAGAIGLEAAVGVWSQDPKGDLGYKGTPLSLENELKYDTETQFSGRIKIDMPLIIPNIYLMATPMKFDGAGSKTMQFTFGDQTFTGNIPFTSEVKLDHYDVALFYGIPFLKTATLGKLNAEVGLNVRVIDFEAEIVQSGIRESKTATLPIPMVYLGLQFKPLSSLSIEGEARGVSYSDNHYYDLIGRVKYKFLGPAFAAGGYRYEDLKIDEEDIRADITFSGPFAEIGVEF